MKRLVDYPNWIEFLHTYDLEKQRQLIELQDHDIQTVDLKLRTEFTAFQKDFNEIRPKHYNPRKEMTTDRETYYSLVNGTYDMHPSKTFPFTLKQKMLYALLDKTCIYDWLYEAFAYGEYTALFKNSSVFKPFSSQDFTAVLGHTCYLFEDVLVVELRKPCTPALGNHKAHEIFQRGPAILLGKSILFFIASFINFLFLAGSWEAGSFYVFYVSLVSFCIFVFNLIWYIYRFVKGIGYTDLYACRAYGGSWCIPIQLFDKKDDTLVYTFKESIDYGKSLAFLI